MIWHRALSELQHINNFIERIIRGDVYLWFKVQKSTRNFNKYNYYIHVNFLSILNRIHDVYSVIPRMHYIKTSTCIYILQIYIFQPQFTFATFLLIPIFKFSKQFLDLGCAYIGHYIYSLKIILCSFIKKL